MTAKLMIREVGQREFTQHNGEFENTPEISGIGDAEGCATGYAPKRTGPENAVVEGERLCREGNVEAFQVWSLVTTKQRVWKLEEVEG